MDKERAKFILQSFRPNGGDAGEPVFAEALKLAAGDRELGEWLAAERAEDAAFAAVLSHLKIPEDLREAIFEVLEGAQDRPAEFDADFVGALAAVRPPSGLREEILGAMEVEYEEQKVEKITRPHRRGYFRVALWTSSVAAVVAVVVGVAAFFAGAGGNALAGTTPQQVESSAIKMLESPFFSLDLQNDRQAALYDWLQKRNLPTPDQLPAGLRGVPGIGCKYLEVGEKQSRGSLICYQKEGMTVHLVIVGREVMEVDVIKQWKEAVEGCHDCPKNEGWAMTRWADEKYAYFLLGKVESEQLAALF